MRWILSEQPVPRTGCKYNIKLFYKGYENEPKIVPNGHIHLVILFLYKMLQLITNQFLCSFCFL